MKYQRFEDLPVWQAARLLAVEVFYLTRDGAFSGYGSLRDQLERAALSVSSNIAEGFERGSNAELIRFLYIARGSSGELRSILSVVDVLPAFRAISEKVGKLQASARIISKQLGGWLRSLKDSGHKGQKFVNEKTRLASERQKDRKAIQEELQRINLQISEERGRFQQK